MNGRLQDLTRCRAGIRQVILRRYLVVTGWAVLTADTDERSFRLGCMHFATRRQVS